MYALALVSEIRVMSLPHSDDHSLAKLNQPDRCLLVAGQKEIIPYKVATEKFRAVIFMFSHTLRYLRYFKE